MAERLKIGKWKIHPICAAVPEPTPEEYAAMAESMKARGIKKSVLVWGGEVISGKTRCRIGEEFGLKVPTQNWNPKSKGKEAVEREIRELIWDEDCCRRHLSASQRAMLVVPLINTEAARPTEKGGNFTTFSMKDAAEKAGVSEKTIQQARDVFERGSTALNDAVLSNAVSAHDAAKVIELPKSQQTAAVNAVRAGEAGTVSAAAGVNGKPRRPKPLPLPEREPGEDEVEEHHKPENLDNHGTLLPNRQVVKRAFSTRSYFKSAEVARNVILNDVYTIAPWIRNGQQFKINCNRLLTALFEELQKNLPTYLCRACGGTGCDRCDDRGYVCAK